MTAGQSRRPDKQPRSERNTGGPFPLKQTPAHCSRQEREGPGVCVRESESVDPQKKSAAIIRKCAGAKDSWDVGGVVGLGGGRKREQHSHSIHSLRNRSRILPACVAETCQNLSG